LGTPGEMLDRDGLIAWRVECDCWGAVRTITGERTDCPIRFQGQWYDAESGLSYNRYRYYDRQPADFISADLFGLLGAINLYGYIADPNLWVDPLGLEINTTSGRTHVTYVGSKGGRPYVGYAGMPGNQDCQDVLSYRYSSGFAAEGLDGEPTVVLRGRGETLHESQAAKGRGSGTKAV
ncbi:MAG: hypothetical protein OEV87_13130, partial [Phycisphaerae bacterium]|nr:hypothetical protein [Phycisphaerae bacterium]